MKKKKNLRNLSIHADRYQKRSHFWRPLSFSCLGMYLEVLGIRLPVIG